MDKATRKAIERSTQLARKLLDDDFSSQLEGTFDVLRSGVIATKGGSHLTARQMFQRDKILSSIDHKQSAGAAAVEAVTDYVRDAAFTTLNRFIALKMLEARELVQECITRGEQSAGYREFCGMAPGLALLSDGAGYRLYLESLFDEFSTEIKVLFDRRNAASVLWPKRQTFDALLATLNAPNLSDVWDEDETLGWVYQFFNSGKERKEMRDRSQAPRNSRELAVRNQFFTPRYVVQFLTDNTLGRIWCEMRHGETRLVKQCEYLVHPQNEAWQPRKKKDPRDLNILDPACGSGHFLLYSFDLLQFIYEEAWSDANSPQSEATGRTLKDDYPEVRCLRRALPGLILRHNLHGVDIDPRCAQIAQLALWMRGQRAFRQFGIARTERPPIRRGNIVIAESMPGEKELLDEFLLGLKGHDLEALLRRALAIRPERTVKTTKAMADSLADLVVTVFNGMKLAGEMGTLLKIERDIARAVEKGRNEWEDRLPLFRVSEYGIVDASTEPLTHTVPDEQHDFWTKAETIVLQALADYADVANGADTARRRLFAEDAAQGFALADLVAKRFDVVLMNPPFGLPPGKMPDYRGLPKDLYCYFVERATELVKPGGRIGAITSSSFRTYIDYEEFRDRFFIAGYVPLLADLGWGILDGAYVETAAYVVLSPGETVESSTLIDVRERSDQQAALRSSIQNAELPNRYSWDLRQFARLPGKPLLYSLTEAAWDRLANADRLDSICEAISKGAGPHVIFYRLRWEVPSRGIGLKRKWVPFTNGGSFSPFRRDDFVLLNWDYGGALVKSYLSQRYPYLEGNTEWNIQMEDHYGRPGLTYGKKTTKFSAQVMPGGGIFSFEGIGVFPRDDRDRWWLLAYLNSEFVRAYLNVTCGLHKNPPYVRNLPLPAFTQAEKELLADLAREGWRLQLSDAQRDERTAVFVSPWRLPASVGRSIVEILLELDEIVDAKMGMKGAELQRLSVEDVDDVDEGDDTPNVSHDNSSCDDALVRSWTFGVAMGRFDVRVATRERTVPPEPDPFDALPAESPGMLPRGDLPFMPCSGILVDDVGHADDLVPRVAAVYERVGKMAPEPQALRLIFAREFFPAHVKMYSRSRRKAPIYWQLAVPSARYSVWLYVHAFTSDTLFRVQNDYVARKLAHEERRIEALAIEVRKKSNAADRNALARQESLVEELRAFHIEVKRVAPLWKPNLDDGVLINFAPLWRLVHHQKAWQKELKGTWDALCEGKFDWAHLAMHLWPERVIPKCATDRSLATAHGLEAVFWVEGDDGKWKSRAVPARIVDDLVRERTSMAVKAALKGLLETNLVNVNGSRGRGRRAATASSD